MFIKKCPGSKLIDCWIFFNTVVENFSDVNKIHYAYEAIKWAQQRGIASGYPDGTFKPNAEITESQFAKMLAKFMAIKDNKGDIINTITPIVP